FAPPRTHRQHQLARRKKFIRRRQPLLRLQVGPPRTYLLHGRRPPRLRHSRHRHLPRLGRHRLRPSPVSRIGQRIAQRTGKRTASASRIIARSAYQSPSRSLAERIARRTTQKRPQQNASALRRRSRRRNGLDRRPAILHQRSPPPPHPKTVIESLKKLSRTAVAHRMVVEKWAVFLLVLAHRVR